MRLVHLDGVEHGCCGPAARADAAEVARIAGFPFEIVDLSDEFDRDGDRRTSSRSTRPVARRTRARAATGRSSSARSCGGPTSSASTSSPPVTTCGPIATTTAAWRLLRGADAGEGPDATCCTCWGSAQLAAVAVPGRRDAEGGDARSSRERFGLPVARQARLAGALLRARAATPAGSSRARAPAARARGGESSIPTGACWPGTTARSRSRSGSGAGSAWRPASPRYVLDVDAAANRVVVGPRRAAVASGGWSPTASRGWPGAPPADGPVRGRGADPLPRRGHRPRSSTPRRTRSGVAFRSAAARRRARARASCLPGRRAARRRPHRRAAARPVVRSAIIGSPRPRRLR